MPDDTVEADVREGELLRPDGRIERLRPRADPASGNYASERPGRADAEAVQAAARRDRRRRRRQMLDLQTGRIFDVKV